MPEPTAPPILHLWQVDHPYHCNAATWHDRDDHTTWSSWADFVESGWTNSDWDRNLLARWDWKTWRNDDPEMSADLPDELRLYFVMQRKGRLISHYITVADADEPQVRAFLIDRATVMAQLWQPLDLSATAPEPAPTPRPVTARPVPAAQMPPGTIVQHAELILRRRPYATIGLPWKSRLGARYDHSEVDDFLDAGATVTVCPVCAEGKRCPFHDASATSQPEPTLVISQSTIDDVAALEERDRLAGGPPWEVADHPDHQLPGGWHQGQIR